MDAIDKCMATKDTTISLKPETKLKLSRLGNTGESYDTVINRLIQATKRGSSWTTKALSN